MDEAELQAATTGEVADSSLRHVIITGYIAQDLTAQDDYASIASIAGQLYEARHQGRCCWRSAFWDWQWDCWCWPGEPDGDPEQKSSVWADSPACPGICCWC